MFMQRKLNLTPALAQCILNNMTVDNGDYMYDLHSWTTAGSLKLGKSAESFTKLSADGKEKNAKTKNAKGSE